MIRRDDDYIQNVKAAIADDNYRRKTELAAIGNVEDCILNADYPTLREVNEKAGAQGVAETIVIAYLRDFVSFCSFTEAVDENQYVYVSRIVVGEYNYLKVRELLLFFAQLKTGKYGEFYGRFDPLLFIKYLKSFIKWRNMRYDEIKQRERDEEWEREKKRCVPLKDFLARHPNGRYENLRKFFNTDE